MAQDTLRAMRRWADAIPHKTLSPDGRVQVPRDSISIDPTEPVITISLTKGADATITAAIAYAFVLHEDVDSLTMTDLKGRTTWWTRNEGWGGSDPRPQPDGPSLVARFRGKGSGTDPAFMGSGDRKAWMKPAPLTWATLPKKDGIPLVDGFELWGIKHDCDFSSEVTFFVPPRGLCHDGIPICASWADMKKFTKGVLFNNRNGFFTAHRTGPGYDVPLLLWPVTPQMEKRMMEAAIRDGTAKTIKVAPSWATDGRYCLLWQQCMFAAIQPWDPEHFTHGTEKTWVYTPSGAATNSGLWTRLTIGKGESATVKYERIQQAGTMHDDHQYDWSQHVVMASAYVRRSGIGTSPESVHLRAQLAGDVHLGGPFSGPWLGGGDEKNDE
jgi:hypothetical protein